MHSFLSPGKAPLTLSLEENSSPTESQKQCEVRRNLDQRDSSGSAEEQRAPNTPKQNLEDSTSIPAPPTAGRGKGKKGAPKKVSQRNRKVTDYYPIRRSSRKSKSELKSEEQRHIDDLIRNGTEEGLKVSHMEGKGRGVFADRRFQKGQFVVEYHGDLVQMAEAKSREATYSKDPATGCYMYYFQYLGKTYCVDATMETDRLGRLVNHSKSGNLQTKLHDVGGVPHLILVASRDIQKGEELLYDYGDRSKEAIMAHPWLKH
uniref:[histone H4]-lysine(20) N-methyltransferase n=2 Tax=Denticeps clupeoides TaxID=299321 RepID=A0AAY4DXN9_9TELE